MSHLAISLLGSFRVTLGGIPIQSFRTDKARALLVYLAAEAPRPQRRETLAGMFWPDRPQAAARNNLRQTLYRLRTAIDARGVQTPYLLTTANEIQLNPEGDYALDVDRFSASLAVWGSHHPDGYMLCENCLAHLREAVSLYGGDFLAGFSLPGCPQFEWWLLAKQELYHHQASEALALLGNYYESCGDYHQVSRFALQEIDLDPWRESAHRRRMRALALQGECIQALRQYESCRSILAQEMGIEPSQQTKDLFKSIRAGRIPAVSAHQVRSFGPAVHLPDVVKPTPSAGSFVGFEPELTQLECHLAAARSGFGQVVFISGEAGSGKTALLTEFIRRSLGAYGDLLAAIGYCESHFGYGDPYMPFRQVLCWLTGDMQANRAVDALGKECAWQISSALPAVLGALLEDGPGLIDTFLPVEHITRHPERLGDQAAGLIKEINALSARRQAGRPPASFHIRQPALFDQFIRVLLAIARRYPLILALDDLQWADHASLSLLFHLAHGLRGSRILLIGAFRPEEITLDQKGADHPVRTLVNELQTQYGELTVDLSLVDGWDFINALLDCDLKELDIDFRKALFELTEGHPLFAIEQLRLMQDGGGMVQDDAGRWIIADKLAWERIPVRADSLIAERLARPAAECRAILEAASVQGEVFDVGVLAGVLGQKEANLVKYLSGELCQQHRLVFAEGFKQDGDIAYARYRFRHTLYRRHIYQNLDAVRRIYLQQATAQVLEMRAADRARAMAVEEASTPKM